VCVCVCVFSVLCVVITCVLMTYVEHDPMQEILAKPLYAKSLDLVLEFRRSEPALRVTVSKLGFQFRRSRVALCVTLSAAQSRRYALRGLPLGILRYICELGVLKVLAEHEVAAHSGEHSRGGTGRFHHGWL
jgi:hypothetical protein